MTLPKPSPVQDGASAKWTYFLDESGNSGDLARPGAQFNFGGQEVFVLVAVGVTDSQDLPALLERLRDEHRVQAPELKFDAVRKKPRFFDDLLAGLIDLQANLLSEVVDKRYFIAAHMVSSLVLPPIAGIAPSAEEAYVRNGLAEYLAKAPLRIFQAFVAACQEPSAPAVLDTFAAILTWLDETHRDERAEALRHAAELGQREFREGGPDDPETLARWLPAPDPGLSGAPLWILPNLSSFTNLYARINLAHRRQLSGVRLLHDEQRYYAHVLNHNKRAAEELAARGLAMGFRHADWNFETPAELTFADSRETPGVQVADVLAGFLMTHVRNALYRTHATPPEWRAFFGDLVDLSDPARGLGMNIVAPESAFRRLGMLPKIDPWIASAFSGRR